jgi:hypothetical protein
MWKEQFWEEVERATPPEEEKDMGESEVFELIVDETSRERGLGQSSKNCLVEQLKRGTLLDHVAFLLVSCSPHILLQNDAQFRPKS